MGAGPRIYYTTKILIYFDICKRITKKFTGNNFFLYFLS